MSSLDDLGMVSAFHPFNPAKSGGLMLFLHMPDHLLSLRWEALMLPSGV